MLRLQTSRRKSIRVWFDYSRIQLKIAISQFGGYNQQTSWFIYINKGMQRS